MIAAALMFAAAASASQSPSSAGAAPVLVELFTSQSCSSCPPAEAILRDLADRPDVVALEWHVDYWNNLSVGAAGRWRDPFSLPEFTRRQSRYGIALRRDRQVYTPQAVIDGRLETVGSRRSAVEALIAERRKPAGEAALAQIETARADGAVSVAATGPKGAEVRLVRFRKSAMTHVGGGENANAALAEAHVVFATEVIGKIGADAVRAKVTAPAAGDGCAVLVEQPDGGPVFAARYCG